MSRQRFSEMLGNRRRELGLSIEQASRILRLREDVLVAFEEGDFERMPQSGYAQGMLSSYARYLGLDPRRITDYFQEELFEYVNGSSSHELRRHTRDGQAGRGVRGYDLPNEVSSRPKAYVEYHALLPTAGGPAGDMGAFATTTPAHPRRSMPLAGSGPSAAEAYGSQSYEGAYRPGSSTRARRPYNSSQRDVLYGEQPDRAERQRRRNSQQRRRYDSSDPSRRLISSEQRVYGEDAYDVRGERYMRDDVNRRGIRPREYVDDMRYDDGASPYERASTINGRRSSRNIAPVERPNVRRRAGSGGTAGQGRGGRGSRSRDGGRRTGGFFADPQRSLFLLVIVLAAVLVGILLFSVNSCVSGGSSSASQKSVSVSSAESGSSSQSSSSSVSSGTATSSSGATGATSASGSATSGSTSSVADASATYVPTVVKVSVASGSYTWLEVTSDGVSDVAESVTGPWEKEYTVTESLSVQAGDPSVVTVTNNGQAVSFTSKASGLGSLTVKGTKPPETTDDTSKDGDSAEPQESEADSDANTSAQ